MIILENDQLTVGIKSTGAELQSIVNKRTEIEYLWHGDPAYWGKRAPILFPIVGTLRDNVYRYRGIPYSLSRHGFARDMEFTLIYQNKNSASLELRSSDITLHHYPFPFILRVHYSLEGNQLTNQYEVINTGNDQLLFSLGGHPAFNVPLERGLNYDDYYLEFSEPETLPRWNLEGNLIAKEKPFLIDEAIIPLSHKLFESDAIVLKQPKSDKISLRSHKSEHGLTMTIQGFPYLGIWAAPGAPFVCIEPWCGLADSVDHNQELEQKEGIMFLGAGEQWEKSWSLTCW